jgi:hypothetical protein
MMPSGPAQSGVADGDTAPPADTEQSTTSRRRTLFGAAEALARWFEVLRKMTVSVAITLAVGVVIVLIVREVNSDGIAIDPVIVQISDPKEGATPELAARQIAKHIDLMQRASPSEWRRLYVDQAPVPIDLQVPGAPISLRTGIREVAALFGIRRPTIRAAILGRTVDGKPTYVASVGVVGNQAAAEACTAPPSATGMDDILECIALTAIGFIDPKVAASHAFRVEERNCSRLGSGMQAGITGATKELELLKDRRTHCGFAKTQFYTAKVLEQGRPQDLVWVPFVLGRIHLARAAALDRIDGPQLGEFDQAIARFSESLERVPNSETVQTSLLEAYVLKGASLHRAATTAQWDDDQNSAFQKQLRLAEATFSDATQRLLKIVETKNGALDARIERFRGLLYFRQWMLMAHRRTRMADPGPAIDHADELDLLSKAASRYEAAAKGGETIVLFVEWGDVLRASGKFNDAVGKYARAAFLSPTDDSVPRLGIAAAYLDRVEYGRAPADPIHLVVALGATSDYLSWVAGGGLFSNITPRIERALERTGVPEDVEAFRACQAEAGFGKVERPFDLEVEKWKATATLKYCVNQAIERVNRRMVFAPMEAKSGKAP